MRKSNTCKNRFFIYFFNFRDIFTSLLDGRVCTAIRDLLVERVKKSETKIDAIVGLDARGFLFGYTISAELGIPFVPIRKKGKLPGKCRSFEYTLEYGSGVLEIQENSISKGQNVVIVDDLLATGGNFINYLLIIIISLTLLNSFKVH